MKVLVRKLEAKNKKIKVNMQIKKKIGKITLCQC